MSRAPPCGRWISVVTRGGETLQDAGLRIPQVGRAGPVVFALVDPWWTLRDAPVSQPPLETERARHKVVGDLCHRARSVVGGCERSTRSTIADAPDSGTPCRARMCQGQASRTPATAGQHGGNGPNRFQSVDVLARSECSIVPLCLGAPDLAVGDLSGAD